MKKKFQIDKKFKSFVSDWIEKYETLLQVKEYHGSITYKSEDAAIDNNGDQVVAQCKVDHRYLRADYNIYPNLFRRWKDKQFETVKKCLAHEVAHIATHKLHWMATCVYKDEGETIDAWEALTEKVGRLIYDLKALKDK